MFVYQLTLFLCFTTAVLLFNFHTCCAHDVWFLGESTENKTNSLFLFSLSPLAVGGHARGRTASIDQERPPYIRDSLPQGCSRLVIERRHDNRRVTESRETLDLESHRIIGDFACPFHQLALDVTLPVVAKAVAYAQTGYFYSRMNKTRVIELFHLLIHHMQLSLIGTITM